MIMSMRRIAVLAAVHSSQLNNTPGYNSTSNNHGKTNRYDNEMHENVNVLLGGAMMSGLIFMIVFICYCCHRNVNKQRPHEYTNYWRPEPEIQNLEIFTMDSHAMGRFLGAPQCWEQNGPDDLPTTMSLPCIVNTGPPPSYESLIFNSNKNMKKLIDRKESSSGNDSTVCTLSTVDDNENCCQQLNNLKKEDDEELPSYETALKLEANGYV